MPTQPARFGASYGQTAPKSYSSDYSKWDRIVDSDSDDEPSTKSKSKSKSKSKEINSVEELDANDKLLLQAAKMAQQGQMSGNPSLVADSMRMAESALRSKGVPEQEVQKVMQEEKAKFGLIPAPLPDPENEPLNIHSAKGKMKNALSAHEKELERLQEQEEMLGRLNSPEDFFKFMTESGMSEEQIQRMMSGDTSAMEEAIRKQESNVNDAETAKTLSQVDGLTAQIKSLSQSKEKLLQQQSSAAAELQNKKEAHKDQLEQLRSVEAHKAEIEQKMAEAEELMKQGDSAAADSEEEEEVEEGAAVPKYKVARSRGLLRIADSCCFES